MGKDYYYIYCQGILGVKTNLRDFRWIYGSTAPSATREAYERAGSSLTYASSLKSS